MLTGETGGDDDKQENGGEPANRRSVNRENVSKCSVYWRCVWFRAMCQELLYPACCPAVWKSYEPGSFRMKKDGGRRRGEVKRARARSHLAPPLLPW